MASACGVALPLSATLGAGLSLGLAVAFSPFLGGLFSLVFGGAMLLDTLRLGRAAWPGLVRQSLAAVPVALAVALGTGVVGAVSLWHVTMPPGATETVPGQVCCHRMPGVVCAVAAPVRSSSSGMIRNSRFMGLPSFSLSVSIWSGPAF